MTHRQTKKIPLYGGFLTFINSECVKEVKKFCPVFEEREELFAHAISGVHRKRRNYFIVVNDKHPEGLSYGVVAHEASHIAMFLMEDLGIELSFSNSETFRYLVQYITNEFCIFAKRNNLKIK